MNLGPNVKSKINGNTLTLVINLDETQGPSKSGKSTIVASTNGNVPVPGSAHPDMRIGVNVYMPTGS